MKIENIPQPETAERREDALAQQLRFWRRSIAKHKLALTFLTLLVGSIAAFVVYSIPPVYRATTTLFIEPTKSKVVNIEEVYGGLSGNRDHIQTQAEILKSRDLAVKLVKRLKLDTDPTIDPRQKPASFDFSTLWKDWIPAGWLAQGNSEPEMSGTEAAVAAVLANREVQLVRNSYLIKVSFESTDKALAARAANALADVYIEGDLEARLQMTQQAASWLTSRVKGLREALESSERALQQFRDKERIVDSKGVALGASSQLTTLTTTLVAARQKVAEFENSYRQVQAVLKGESRLTLESLPAVMRSASVAKARETENEAERRVAEASKRYGPDHPRMIGAEADLRAARESKRAAVDTAVSSITREYEVAKATEQQMQASLESSKNEIQSIGRKEFQLAALERDVQTNRQLYELFTNRFKETSVTGDLQSTIARIMDPAIVPATPVKPQKARIISIALVLGLMLGVMLAFLLEYLDNTLRSTDDVSTKLEAPLLGILPWVRANHKKYQLQRAILDNINPPFSEAVRTLRTGVLMSALDNPHKVVLVTSSVPEEGKTSVATNLAFALSQVKRTCLIDADMRRPQVSRILGGEAGRPGLSNLVAGTDTASNCVHQHESGLFFIPSGPIPPNPLELLSSRRFADVLAKLEESFDVILIDSPPVQLVSDAVVLSGVANALIFVVRADATPHQVAKGALELLKKGRAQLLGVVLNQLDVEKSEKYYGYGKFFSYGGKYKYYKKYGYYGTSKK